MDDSADCAEHDLRGHAQTARASPNRSRNFFDVGGVGVPCYRCVPCFVEVFAHLPAHVPERREDDDDGDRDGCDRCGASVATSVVVRRGRLSSRRPDCPSGPRQSRSRGRYPSPPRRAPHTASPLRDPRRNAVTVVRRVASPRISLNVVPPVADSGDSIQSSCGERHANNRTAPAVVRTASQASGNAPSPFSTRSWSYIRYSASISESWWSMWSETVLALRHL